MKLLIKNSWKHLLVAFIIQVLITVFVPYFEANMFISGQMLLAFVTWFILNLGFEIFQKNRLNGQDTHKEILFDCIFAGFGGVLGVLIGNVLI